MSVAATSSTPRNRVRAVQDESGRATLLVGAAADITERKLFQKALIEYLLMGKKNY